MAFSGTDFIGSVEIPETVTKIGSWAFENCTINDFYFLGNAPEVIHADEGQASFDKDEDVIYYLPENAGSWVIEDGRWNGYSVFVLRDVLFGDVNEDEKINVLDANLIRKFAAKLIELVDNPFTAADVNGDGKVNVLDANLIRKYAAKIIESFPVEG